MDKRTFLRTLGGAAAGAVFGERLWRQCAAREPLLLAQDEAFWADVRARYALPAAWIDLENGYYSRQSRPVLDAFVGHVRAVNEEGAHYMRTRQDGDRMAARTALAALAGCPVDEVVVTRNTTESLDTVIAGQPWQRGDEAVMAAQDYGAMLDMFELQARRHGIANKVVSLPLDPASDDEIVALYRAAIGARTRLLMVCHVVNITGQILPVRKIADMAHERGVQVMIDGAHALAQLDFAVPDLGGDYYAASLHKWLGCPLGAGLLWVKKARIAGLWPLFASGLADDDIEKLNHRGTHPVHTDLALHDAIAFHQGLGAARKEARLRHLQRYWTQRVRGQPRIELFTPGDPARACAIATVGIRGTKPADLAAALFDRHKVYTVAIDHAGVHGVRVTPHVFTTTAELDVLVGALQQLAAG